MTLGVGRPGNQIYSAGRMPEAWMFRVAFLKMLPLPWLGLLRETKLRCLNVWMTVKMVSGRAVWICLALGRVMGQAKHVQKGQEALKSTKLLNIKPAKQLLK